MNAKNTDFPQYRMLSNGKSFYKITHLRHFEEIQKVGSRFIYSETNAEQYPEILRIQDMLAENSDFFVVSSEKDWEEVFQKSNGVKYS